MFRTDAPLEVGQPEERHGFTQYRHLEEPLLTKRQTSSLTHRAVGLPIRVLSLDLSNTFRREGWQRAGVCHECF